MVEERRAWEHGLSHSQMICVVLNLLGLGSSTHTVLRDYGYEVLRLEISLPTEWREKHVVPDLVVTCDDPPGLDLVEVKSGPELNEEQISKYIETNITNAIQITGYTVSGDQLPFFGFWALGNPLAMSAISNIVENHPASSDHHPIASQIGIGPSEIRHLNGDIGNPPLQTVLADGYSYDLNDFDLALLPPDLTSQLWKFSDHVFTSAIAVWRRSPRREFTLEDVFEEAFGPFLQVMSPDNRRATRDRVQDVLKRMRATALKGLRATGNR